MKATLFLILFAGLISAGEPSAKTHGIDILSSPFIRDGKGNFMLVRPEKTPFDSIPEARKRYLDSYAAGFYSVLTGVISTHSPMAGPYLRAESEGWIAGQSIGERALIYKSIKSHK